MYCLEVEGANTVVNTNGGQDMIDLSVIRGDLLLDSGDGGDTVNVLQVIEGDAIMVTGQGPDIVDVTRVKKSLRLDSGTEDE